MKFQGFVGPSYTLDSVNVDAQRCVNMYPEQIESGSGKEGQQYYLRNTPGLLEQFIAGDGPIRCIHQDPAGQIFVVSGNEVYKCVYTGTSWIKNLLPEVLLTSTGPVKAASIYSSTTEYFTVFVDGSTSYLYWFLSPDEYFGPFSDFAYPAVTSPTHVVFIDGYLVYTSSGTNQFFVSDWNLFTVDALSFASAEGDPDRILGIEVLNRNLWIFNEQTTEVFSNTGNPDFPFERVSGGFLEVGTCAKFSIAKGDGYIFWLGRSKSGDGQVYMSNGLSPQRISTHAIEQAIAGYSDISTATGYAYQSGGHNFYVLNFNETSWCFDVKTGLWHERAYTGDVSLERHRADMHCFYPEYRLHLVGDYATNKIYSLDDEVYSDNTNPITRLRSFPHISSGGKTLIHKSLTLDMETGVGLVSGQGSDPQVVLDWSNDGGHTWSDESWTSAGGQVGGVGEYKTRVQWRRLGKARDRVYRVQITDPVKVVMMGVDLEIGQGNS